MQNTQNRKKRMKENSKLIEISQPISDLNLDEFDKVTNHNK